MYNSLFPSCLFLFLPFSLQESRRSSEMFIRITTFGYTLSFKTLSNRLSFPFQKKNLISQKQNSSSYPASIHPAASHYFTFSTTTNTTTIFHSSFPLWFLWNTGKNSWLMISFSFFFSTFLYQINYLGDLIRELFSPLF